MSAVRTVDGCAFDLGGAYVGMDGRRASYRGEIPKLPLATLLQVQLFLSRLDRARVVRVHGGALESGERAAREVLDAIAG